MPTQQQQLEATLRAAVSRETPPANVTTSARGPLAGRSIDRDAFVLKVGRIRPDRNQVRRMHKSAGEPEIKELAESIRQLGLQNALDVRWIEADDIYQLVAGERRFVAATEILGWSEIPVRVVNAKDEDLVWLQLHENLQRADLHPLDVARALQALADAGATLNEIAKRLCKSKTWVQKALTVAKNLSPQAQQELQQSPRRIAMESAYEVAQVPGSEQLPLVRRIVTEGLSRAELRDLATESKNLVRRERRKRGRPPGAKAFRRTLKLASGTTVTIQFRKARVTNRELIEVLHAAAKQLAA